MTGEAERRGICCTLVLASLATLDPERRAGGAEVCNGRGTGVVDVRVEREAEVEGDGFLVGATRRPAASRSR